MKKFLVLILGSVDGITQWVTETISWQQWFALRSTTPPVSIWWAQISISVIWPLTPTYWLICICRFLTYLSCFWRKQWSLCSSVTAEVNLNLELLGTTFLDLHLPPICPASQLAVPSLPCQHRCFHMQWDPSESWLFKTNLPLLPQFGFSPDRLSELVHCTVSWVSALAPEKQQ